MGTRGVMPSAGLDVEVSGLTVAGTVSFPPEIVRLFTAIDKTGTFLLHTATLFHCFIVPLQ